MNKLTGFIKEIKTCDEIIQLFIDVNDEIFSSLILSSKKAAVKKAGIRMKKRIPVFL